MDLRVAAYAVVERRGKILLTHWRRGHLHGWTLPGGGIEAGEDPRDAVVREVEEETGLEARVGKLLGVDSRVMVREDVPEGVAPELHTIRIVYRATVKDGPLRNEIGGSSDEARWVPLREIKSLRTLSLVQTGLRMAGVTLRRGPDKEAPKKGDAAKKSDAPKKQGAKQGGKQGQPRGKSHGGRGGQQAAQPAQGQTSQHQGQQQGQQQGQHQGQHQGQQQGQPQGAQQSQQAQSNAKGQAQGRPQNQQKQGGQNRSRPRGGSRSGRPNRAQRQQGQPD